LEVRYQDQDHSVLATNSFNKSEIKNAPDEITEDKWDITGIEEQAIKCKKNGKMINSLKNGENMEFEAFQLKLGMSYEDYILAIRTSITNKIFMKRKIDEARINSYNKTLLQCWRANMDL
jgi:hypothetical protein